MAVAKGSLEWNQSGYVSFSAVDNDNVICKVNVTDLKFQCLSQSQPCTVQQPDKRLIKKPVSASKEGVVLFPPPIDILGKTNIF